MDLFRTIEISAAGMVAQKTRVETAAVNLANMNSSIAAGGAGFRPLTTVIRAAAMPFARLLEGGRRALPVAQAEVVARTGIATRSVYEPGHPDADAAGMVAYPAVDHTSEMLTVMTALRAYEANLAVLQVTKTLAAKALEIGSQ